MNPLKYSKDNSKIVDITVHLIIILLHRIGLIVLVISSGVMMALPTIFSEQRDQEYANNAYGGLLLFSRIALVLIGVTGLLRLNYGIPNLIYIKIPLGLLTGVFFFFIQNEYRNKNFMRICIMRLLFVISTATVGLIL